jgi:hypothetical protein
MQQTQKIELLDQANIECSWGNPKSKLIDSPEWAQIITPGARHSSANCVFRSRLSPREAKPKVEQTIAFYENMNVPFRWLVTPLTEPAGFEELLLKHELSLHYEATAMLCPVENQIHPLASGIRVEQIGLARLEVYIETFIRSWQLPTHQIGGFRDDVRRGLEQGNGRFIPFVAYRGETSVGTSALLNLPSGAYLRGQGIYRAMVSHRARIAQSLGQSLLLIHAKKETSAPILTRLGFESVYDYKVLSQEV